MSFNSLHFLAFFSLLLSAYFLIVPSFRRHFLLAASLYFYMAWRPEYIVLLLSATLIGYVTGLALSGTDSIPRRRQYIVLCMVLLLGDLFVFKYFNFVNDNVRILFASLRLPYEIPAMHLLLPLGISFYTFELLSYVIDVYRGTLRAERDFSKLLLFVAFFPKLVAGPIERGTNLLPQFDVPGRFEYGRITDGLKLMAWGFFKKLVVADRLSPLVQKVYETPSDFDGVTLTLATVLFAFQVYCDFSGYSDIAVGAAETLGYRLNRNFDRPYFATSIQDFWKRWHISLSTWLTDYVYTPLTRSRFLKLSWYHKFLASLFLTFIVSGLWHGAQWTFVAWGALHGTYLVSSMLTQKVRRKMVARFKLNRVPVVHRVLRTVFTFTLVCISYIFFRAESMGDATYILTHVLTGWDVLLMKVLSRGNVLSGFVFAEDLAEFALGVYGIIAVLLVDHWRASGSLRAALSVRPAWQRWSLYYAHAGMILVLGAYNSAHQFIYFQF